MARPFACTGWFSNALGHTICLARVDLLAGLLDLLQHRRIVNLVLCDHIRGLRVEGNIERLNAYSQRMPLSAQAYRELAIERHRPGDRTIELLEHTLDRAGAAAAGHGDVELVVVLCHIVVCTLYTSSTVVSMTEVSRTESLETDE